VTTAVGSSSQAAVFRLKKPLVNSLHLPAGHAGGRQVLSALPGGARGSVCAWALSFVLLLAGYAHRQGFLCQSVHLLDDGLVAVLRRALDGALGGGGQVGDGVEV